MSKLRSLFVVDDDNTQSPVTDKSELDALLNRVATQAPTDASVLPSPSASVFPLDTPISELTTPDIPAVYQSANITGDGVYIVPQLLDSLPESLDRESKRVSLLSILKATGNDANTLLTDAELRIAALENHAVNVSERTARETAANTEEIESLRTKVAALEQSIRDAQETERGVQSQTKRELDKLNAWKSYLQ